MPELAKKVLARLRQERGEELPPEPPSEARLTHAYQTFWRLGEDAPLDAYHSALVEIREAEAALSGMQVQTILKKASRAWHRETGRCPFCGGADLHGPAEAMLEGAA